jgi:hypothetical protein
LDRRHDLLDVDLGCGFDERFHGLPPAALIIQEAAARDKHSGDFRAGAGQNSQGGPGIFKGHPWNILSYQGFQKNYLIKSCL